MVPDNELTLQWIFPALAFATAALVTLLGLRAYTRLRATPSYVLLPLFLAFFIPFSIVVLVPIDLVSSSEHHAKDALFYLSQETRLVIWRVVYWLAFFLTWLVLPLLQSYVDSGYYSVAKRLRDAVNQNLIYQLVISIAGTGGLVYVAFSAGLTWDSLKALVIALSHSYALVFAMWLMGHGMVSLPRRYWADANPQRVLRKHYRNATLSNDRIAEAQNEYAKVAAEVLALSVYKKGRLMPWIRQMLDAVEAGSGVPLNKAVGTVRLDRSMINESYLASLNSQFKASGNRLRRYDAEWQKFLFETSQLEDIVGASDSQSLEFRYKYSFLSPNATYFVYGQAKPWVNCALAVAMGVLSFIIVWSEIAQGTTFSIVNFAMVHTSNLVQQLVSTVFLGYMCACAVSSLLHLRVYKYYALVYRHSDLGSLLFYAMYVCRLTIPLCYSYTKMILNRDSVFESFLGQYINLTPLGRYFNDWLPRCILIPMLFTFFNVYARIRDLFSFESSFDEEADVGVEGASSSRDTTSVLEGRELVKKALSDPSYRFALRHPQLSAVPEASSSSNLSIESASTVNSLRTSSKHLNQLPTSSKRTHGGKLHLGGGQVKRTRLEDNTPVVGSSKIDMSHDPNRGFIATMLGRRQSSDQVKSLLPGWQRTDRDRKRGYDSTNER